MSQAKSIQKGARRLVEALQEQYGMETIPENVEATLKLIAAPATILPRSQNLADAAVRKMEMACLAAWARGEVTGPDTPESLERRAVQAENLAKMFDKKDDQVGFRKQMKRAEQLRAQAAAIAKQKETPHA